VSIAVLANRLAGLVGGEMGNYATGTATVKSTAAEGTVPGGTYAYPIIDGSLDPDLLVVVARNADTTDGSWPVTSSGTSVGIEAVLGGTGGNLPAGTELRWHPVLDGIEELSRVAAPGLTGGTFSEAYGALRCFRQHKDFDSKEAAEALFFARVPTTPAAVLSWEATIPGGGSTVASVGMNPSRGGRGKQVYNHTWQLFLCTSRFDSEDLRRREGQALLDNLLEQLTDRSAWRGFGISGPQGIQVLEARLQAITPESYVDLIRFTTSFTLVRRDARTFNPWLKTHLRLHKPADEALEPTELDLVDSEIDMP